MSHNVFTEISERISTVCTPEGEIHTEAFLAICRCVLPIIDKLGTSFYPAKADVGGNIERLTTRAKQDPSGHALLFDVVRKEMIAGEHHDSRSATKGLLWLKRFLEFVIALLRNLSDPQATLFDASNEAYKTCLQPFHGFIAGGAFTIVLNLCGTRESFEEAIGGETDDRSKFLEGFPPIVESIHQFLVANGLDDPTKV
mmetsp:Transcript_9417/g.17670  ORF Transcript_9417/g.17670 Transcript_9417/m.17670 type:complete len:199 (+) Transcript_9417:34-630(+)